MLTTLCRPTVLGSMLHACTGAFLLENDTLCTIAYFGQELKKVWAGRVSMSQPIPSHQLWLLAENRPTSSGQNLFIEPLIYIVFKLQKQVDFLSLEKPWISSCSFILNHTSVVKVLAKKRRNFYRLWLTLNSNITMVLQT